MESTAENTAPVETPEVDSEVVETPSAESAPAGKETPASGDDPSTWTEKAQKRFDTLTREKYEGLSRAERAEYKAQMLEQRLAELEAAAKPQPVAPVKPTLESCGWNEEEFERQLVAYHGRQSTASTANVSEAVKAQLAAEREAERREQTVKSWERKEAEFTKSKPDYVEKVHGGLAAKTWVCTKEMAEAIAETGGPEIGYYLAENGPKSFEIARLPPHLQAAEIGRIAGKLEAMKAATPPPVSKAPPPVAKIDAEESATTVRADSAESDSLSDAEWTRRRNAQEAARLKKLRA